MLRLGHLSPAQARALRLADNQIALNSGWDEALLAAEIARIRDEAVVDLDVLGFSGIELDRLLASIDPEAARYVDVAVRRWQNFTGRAAVLAGEERVFNDIAAARGVQAAA